MFTLALPQLGLCPSQLLWPETLTRYPTRRNPLQQGGRLQGRWCLEGAGGTVNHNPLSRGRARGSLVRRVTERMDVIHGRSALVELLLKEKAGEAMCTLLTELRPLFVNIPKAKTAKMVRGVIEALSKIPNTTALQVRCSTAMPCYAAMPIVQSNSLNNRPFGAAAVYCSVRS